MRYFLRAVVALGSVGVAYGLSSLLRINHFVWTLLKDRYYEYVSIFLPLLAIWCCVYLFIRIDGRSGLIGASFAGLVGGYICGLLAFLLLPIYGNDAGRRIFTAGDLGSALFLSPLIAMNWFTGLIAAWVIWGVWVNTRPLK